MKNAPSDQLLPSAKRESRRPIDARHDYYAGYSQSFVHAAIEALGLRRGCAVLDPWSGSGTTGAVAQRVGLKSFCVEINAVTAHLALGNLALSSLAAEALDEVFATVVAVNQQLKRDGGEVSGEKILSALQNDISPAISLAWRGKKLSTLSPPFALSLSLALRAYRKSAGALNSKNPSWGGTAQVTVQSETFAASLVRELETAREAAKLAREPTTALQIVGDSRRLPFPNEVFDAIITSPPYLTRIDYVKSTAAEIEWLYGSDQVRIAREDNMGAPVIRKSIAAKNWPKASLVADFVAQISAHSSYAAQSYYLKTFLQYFEDMTTSLREIHRVLKPNGVALLVVQNSYFKEIEIPLGELYVDLWNRLFGAGEIVSRHDVPKSMLQLNRRAISSRLGLNLHEDTIALYK